MLIPNQDFLLEWFRLTFMSTQTKLNQSDWNISSQEALVDYIDKCNQCLGETRDNFRILLENLHNSLTQFFSTGNKKWMLYQGALLKDCDI